MDMDACEVLKPSERVARYSEKVEEIKNEYIQWFHNREFPFAICWLVAREFPDTNCLQHRWKRRLHEIDVKGFFEDDSRPLIDVLDYMYHIRYELYTSSNHQGRLKNCRRIRANRRHLVQDSCEQSYRRFDQMTSFIQPGRQLFAYVAASQIGSDSTDYSAIPSHPHMNKFSHMFRRFCWDDVLQVSVVTTTKIGEPGGLHIQDRWGNRRSISRDVRMNFTVELKKDQFSTSQQETLDSFWRQLSDIPPSKWDSCCTTCKKLAHWTYDSYLVRTNAPPFLCNKCERKDDVNHCDGDGDGDGGLETRPKTTAHSVDGLGLSVEFDQGDTNVMNEAIGSVGFRIQYDHHWSHPEYNSRPEQDASIWVQLLISSTRRFYQLMDQMRISFLSPHPSLECATTTRKGKRKRDQHVGRSCGLVVIEFCDWIVVPELWKDIFEYELDISDRCVGRNHRYILFRDRAKN